MSHKSEINDPNPGFGCVPLVDKTWTGLALLLVPWQLSVFTLHRLSNIGHNEYSLKRGLATWLARSVLPHFPITVSRAMISPNIAGVLEKPRFCENKANVHDEYVRQADFSAQWLLKGPPGKAVAPASCDLVIYYMHGGAYRTGACDASLVSFLRIAEILATKGISVGVLSLNYSLTPEAKFPKPIDQAVAGYKYLLREVGVDASRIAFQGDSAGGHLSLCLLSMLASHRLPSPGAGVILVSPWIDVLCSSRSGSYVRNKYNDFVDADDLGMQGRVVVGEAGSSSWYADFSRPLIDGRSWKDIIQCKVWVCAGSGEIMLDDIARFVGLIKSENIEAVLDVKDGGMHVWQAIQDRFVEDAYLTAPGPQCPDGIMLGAANIAQGVLSVYPKHN
ncbi:hypothetical protein AAFC00_004994 [Neodothiora populina]